MYFYKFDYKQQYKVQNEINYFDYHEAHCLQHQPAPSPSPSSAFLISSARHVQRPNSTVAKPHPHRELLPFPETAAVIHCRIVNRSNRAACPIGWSIAAMTLLKFRALTGLVPPASPKTAGSHLPTTGHKPPCHSIPARNARRQFQFSTSRAGSSNCCCTVHTRLIRTIAVQRCVRCIIATVSCWGCRLLLRPASNASFVYISTYLY